MQVFTLVCFVFAAAVPLVALQYGSALIRLPKFMEETKLSLDLLDHCLTMLNGRLDLVNSRLDLVLEVIMHMRYATRLN